MTKSDIMVLVSPEPVCYKDIHGWIWRPRLEEPQNVETELAGLIGGKSKARMPIETRRPYLRAFRQEQGLGNWGKGHLCYILVKTLTPCCP